MQINIQLDDELLTNNEVSVVERNNGIEQSYVLSVGELQRLINGSIQQVRYESPYLPSNIIKFSEMDTLRRVYVEVPKNRWHILFAELHHEVGFPRLLVGYDVKKEPGENKFEVAYTQIFALKDKEPINDDTPLYAFPYTHVQRDGNVCMGGNRLPPISCLSQLESYHNFFLHSPFSTDYGTDTTLEQSIAKLFTDTFNEKDFDDDCLIQVNKTIGELFDR